MINFDIETATKTIQDYWVNYHKQPSWAKYPLETFLKDAVYAIGLAIDHEKYIGPDGFDNFKRYLVGLILEERQGLVLAPEVLLKHEHLQETQRRLIPLGLNPNSHEIMSIYSAAISVVGQELQPPKEPEE